MPSGPFAICMQFGIHFLLICLFIPADNDPVVSGVAKQLKQYFYCGK